MSNIIIGTAGHIDHGKTTLIKALTGVETDTLAEEKKRGISINLGFTYFDLPSGRRAGIVDVPGHEKFIKNMLAGATGMDVVLLIISATEGIMPQTKEHLDILSYLKIKRGIIVLTKSDVADSELKELIKEDIQAQVEKTFLSGAEIIEVDSLSGTGIDDLASKIDEVCASVDGRNTQIPPRINIDRVFTVNGFGTVVTGTLIEGEIHIGDSLEIYPNGLQTKIRNIQVHDENVTKAIAGQRVAVNISNVSVQEIGRGDVLSAPKYLGETMSLDVKINLVPDYEKTLKMWDRLRLYIGTREVMCRIVPLGQDVIEAGDDAYAQLRLEETVVAKNGDNFVIRNYSPMETIGGGVILDVAPKKHKRKDVNLINALSIKEKGGAAEMILQSIEQNKNTDVKKIAIDVGMTVAEVTEKVSELVGEGKVILVNHITIHIDQFNELSEATSILLTKFHKMNNLKSGMSKEELRSKLNTGLSNKDFDELLKIFVGKELIRTNSNFVSNFEFEISYTKEQKTMRAKMLSTLKRGGFTPPSVQDITLGKADFIEVLESMHGNEVVKLDEHTVIHSDFYNQAIELTKKFIHEHGEITLADFRDLTNGSRKYSMTILESFDKNNITKRVENKRVLW